MKLNIKGTFLKCQTQRGTSAKGNDWEKYDVIVLYKESKHIQVTFFGDKFKFAEKIEAGTEVEIIGFLESKEGTTGRYFTGVNGVELKTVDEVKAKVAEAVIGGTKLDKQFDKLVEDDLPF